ncbi:hypothetical protein DIS24_g2231 [Lasiodiplodia hormozganensis]|uniref:Uncharacterized protein n=1 Tax=Lasiodiplodia hormozganensis TaxID=869390 RepID=A0AA39Z201_9PEZI|nr:hypothetical protein DIS24_g2231 [Lasiodiplodia hormozganensis]
MDEKHPLPLARPSEPRQPEPSRPRRALLAVFVRVAVIALLALLVLFFPTGIQSRPMIAWDEDAIPQTALTDVKKVPLEAHIMSKCPDALDCLQLLVLPTMVEISDRINFTLSYIGKPTDHDDGVECKHGESECLGNMIELCAASAYPDPKIYLGFTYCLTRQYEKIPQRHMIEDCAMEHGIDFARINDCLTQDDGGFAADLLQASFVRSSEANVTKSCTIRLDEKVRCIRDNGEWTDCPAGSDRDSLMRDINDLYDQLNGV